MRQYTAPEQNIILCIVNWDVKKRINKSYDKNISDTQSGLCNEFEDEHKWEKPLMLR